MIALDYTLIPEKNPNRKHLDFSQINLGVLDYDSVFIGDQLFRVNSANFSIEIGGISIHLFSSTLLYAIREFESRSEYTFSDFDESGSDMSFTRVSGRMMRISATYTDDVTVISEGDLVSAAVAYYKRVSCDLMLAYPDLMTNQSFISSYRTHTREEFPDSGLP